MAPLPFTIIALFGYQQEGRPFSVTDVAVTRCDGTVGRGKNRRTVIHSCGMFDFGDGNAVFCVKCSKLFTQFSDDDLDSAGRPHCPDCAAKEKLTEAVGLASHTKELRVKGTLSRLVAQHDIEQRMAAAAAEGDPAAQSSNHATGVASSLEEEHESGVAALNNLIVQTRRENNDLRRRLHAALNEVAPEGAGSAEVLIYREAGGPLASLSTLLDGFIPPQLRTTSRYQPLSDKLEELARTWHDRELRLGALQAALLSAEATSVTLQVVTACGHDATHSPAAVLPLLLLHCCCTAAPPLLQRCIATAALCCCTAAATVPHDFHTPRPSPPCSLCSLCCRRRSCCWWNRQR